MTTLTIRKLPDTLVERIKAAASQKGHSLQQEIRELLESRYAERSEIITRIERRWSMLPTTSADEVAEWRR
jgi:plasmid stability protein